MGLDRFQCTYTSNPSRLCVSFTSEIRFIKMDGNLVSNSIYIYSEIFYKKELNFIYFWKFHSSSRISKWYNYDLNYCNFVKKNCTIVCLRSLLRTKSFLWNFEVPFIYRKKWSGKLNWRNFTNFCNLQILQNCKKFDSTWSRLDHIKKYQTYIPKFIINARKKWEKMA